MGTFESTNMTGISGGVLDVYEAERLVESLEPTTPNDVGSSSWLEQHRALDRLNVQAHHNVVSQTDEFVIEALISFDKLPVLHLCLRSGGRRRDGRDGGLLRPQVHLLELH